ncbi:GNAT family N-acetyltransferase [Caulobacter vibrioides]|nr:GNAT family N-acetyltransferase [Caulobacter vibrioides]YP_002516232.2 acetyltransferase, GNAT family [Caulobacter vibrioides NA1000]ACL94324.2 acetyltransferase, GNAT family [Caulobacter vibrioides NA1000]ATC27658.1 N-acetyltransferase [Caulobacter vibrioides]QXZ52897.1 GNAT family N-acetyltransferase [Caulobacter vibrioides]
MRDIDWLLTDAHALRERGELDPARALYDEALEKARATGETEGLAKALRHVSDMDREAGRLEAALAAAEEAATLYGALGREHRLDLANALRLTALALEALGRPALQPWREAGDLYAELDIAAGLAEAERHLGLVVRPAQSVELEPLARLWWQGWRDAHLPIVPEALARLRTLESFTTRMAAALPQVRVLGPVGAPIGLHLIKDDELNQLYLAAEARGAGFAAVLMADAEAHLADAGVRKAWLACAIGNDRAARFYEKSGWTRARAEIVPTETPAGPFPLEVWRYEKVLTRSEPQTL